MIRKTSASAAATFLGLAASLTLGCDDSNGPAAPVPPTGAIEITVSTASAVSDIDPDGYTLSIDGGPGQPVAVNGAVRIGALPNGKHLVRLDGLAANCSVDGANPLSVDVIAENTALPVSFSVSCTVQIYGGQGDWDY